jgi:hypothetical protein
MSISEKINSLRKELPSYVKIVAVSKTRSPEEVLEAYHAGQMIFGENKAQELLYKQPLLPADIHWHFLGHLQTNKVKQIIPFIRLIHSLDSIKLLRIINKEAILINRTIDCLLQFHIATEETKFGLDMMEATELVQIIKKEKITHVAIKGVMGMASFTDDQQLIRKEFQTLRSYFTQLKQEFYPEDNEFSELSFGMSGDYLLAIQEGSTMIRIGTAIFGERNYH